MEVPIGGIQQSLLSSLKRSLNPCFSGSSYRSFEEDRLFFAISSLNPCFSGSSYRRGFDESYSTRLVKVLILVLVEVPIGEGLQESERGEAMQVLILVLVEVPIGV